MNRKAFTLIELMITISIIAMLTTIALPVYDRMILKARSDEAKAVIQSIVFAQERFRQENGNYFPNDDTLIQNERVISARLRIGTILSQSNNFNYFIQDMNGIEDGNFTIFAILRADAWNICTNETIGTICKQDGTMDEDGWVSQWTRGENNHFIEFRYPNRLDNDFTEGGISYENLHTGD